MGLGNLTNFAVSVVLAAALMGNLDRLQLWVIKAQAKLLYESRASTWVRLVPVTKGGLSTGRQNNNRSPKDAISDCNSKQSERGR